MNEMERFSIRLAIAAKPTKNIVCPLSSAREKCNQGGGDIRTAGMKKCSPSNTFIYICTHPLHDNDTGQPIASLPTHPICTHGTGPTAEIDKESPHHDKTVTLLSIQTHRLHVSTTKPTSRQRARGLARSQCAVLRC